MILGHRADDEQAEPAALRRDRAKRRRAIEAAEDALQLGRRDPDAVVGHAHRHAIRRQLLEPDPACGRRPVEYLMALSIRFQTAAFSSSLFAEHHGDAPSVRSS